MRFDVDDTDIMPYRILPQRMESSLYNTIRLGMLRIANPLILTLEEPPNVKCYLYDEKWIFVDLVLNEFPLIVWRDFELAGRGIHEPVPCRAHVYHIMAGRLMGTVLYTIEDYLQDRLRRPQ